MHHALCWPVAGSVLAMPGDRLHGVLAESGAPTAGDPVRFTLIINVWRARPMAISSLPARMLAMIPPELKIKESQIDKPWPTQPPATPVTVSLLNVSDGGNTGWEETAALTVAAAFCTAVHPPLVAITSFEPHSVWMSMHDRAGEIELLVPPLDYAARGDGADLVEWAQPAQCTTVRVTQRRVERLRPALSL